MKYKKFLLSILISLFIFTGNSFAAATGSEDNVPKYEKLYKKGALLIKQGKKLEKKIKLKKRTKNISKQLNILNNQTK